MATATQDAAEQKECQEAGIDTAPLKWVCFRERS
jgi:hypothetical protein